MSKKELKTNAMRILDRNKIPYEYETYECDEFVDGITTADKIGLPHEQVYKTLVTVGKTGGHYVFVIPIAAELDLKKAAKSVGEKSVEMLHVKDITAVTGYVRGGCTAIGIEEAISDCDRFQCTASGIHLCKWREDWNADQIETG